MKVESQRITEVQALNHRPVRVQPAAAAQTCPTRRARTMRPAGSRRLIGAPLRLPCPSPLVNRPLARPQAAYFFVILVPFQLLGALPAWTSQRGGARGASRRGKSLRHKMPENKGAAPLSAASGRHSRAISPGSGPAEAARARPGTPQVRHGGRAIACVSAVRSSVGTSARAPKPFF